MSYYQQFQNQGTSGNTQYGGYGLGTDVLPNTGFSIPSGSMAGSTERGIDYEAPLPQGIIAAFSASGYPGEPPLFQELGVNFSHIKSKTLAVLSMRSTSLNQEIIQDSDMAGPILFCLLFGTLLLLSGKTHFGYIYGVALFGTVGLHCLFKLMSSADDGGLDFLRTASVIGYCLLPLVMLSAIAVGLQLNNFIGYLLSVICVSWCTWAASGFFVRVLNLSNARPLIAYPLGMFYSVFALMTVFVEKKA
ncbi:hypothetical protein CANINC_004615 [Pichia inconspicua]|uniref:Protein YIP n=1 Tax=Pichia inconspicua TaxID=52247 RepID=A0A4T0WW01_9ASCO|nr:hypothetical protein CANINC_004615 [[Candida] inconspicua]